MKKKNLNIKWSCQSCQYWDTQVTGSSSDYGLCRRFPPTVIPELSRDNEGQDDICILQPSTSNFTWCGEYQPKIRELDFEEEN